MKYKKAGRACSLVMAFVLVFSMLQAAAVTALADSADVPVQVNMEGKVSVDEIRAVKTSSENGSVTGQDVSFGDYINLNLHVTDILNAYLRDYGNVVAAESIVGSPAAGEDGAVETSALSGQVQLTVDLPGGLAVSEAASYARSESSLIGVNLASVSGSRAVFDIYMRTASGQDVYNLYNSDRDTNLIFSVYYEGTLPSGTALSDICAVYTMGGSLTFVNNETGDSQTIRHEAVNNRFAIAGGSYGVSYTWSDAPEGLSLPVNETAYSAGSQVTVDSTYLPGYETEGTRNGVEGIFRFSGWRDASGNAVSVTQIPSGGGNITLSGSWTFSPLENAVSEYRVAYRYVSATEGKELPDSLVPPTDENVYSEGDVVMASDPAAERIETEDGAWVSEGFDESVKTASPSEASDGVMTFTKTWIFEAAADAAGSEPSPAANEEIAETDESVSEFQGVSVNAAAANAAAADEEAVDSEVDSTLEEPAAGDDPDEEDETYNVSYAFIAAEVEEGQTDPGELPAAVLACLPAGEAGYKTGDVVTPADPTDEEGDPVDHVDIMDSEDSSKVLGTWYFSGWDSYSEEIEDADITFTGTWFYEENGLYPVIYEPGFEEWDGGRLIDKGPVDEETGKQGYASGEELVVLDNVDEDGDPFYTRDGYTFEGWSVNEDGSGTTYQPGGTTAMPEGGLTLYAKWEEFYGVAYQFVSGTSGSALPSQIRNATPTRVKVNGTETAIQNLKVYDGDKLEPVNPSQTTVKISDTEIWEFKGYSPASATVDGKGVTFTGTWEKKPTYGVSYVFAPSSVPSGVTACLPSTVRVNGTAKSVSGLKVFEGDKLDAVQPSRTTVAISESVVWEFTGYTASSQTVGTSDVVFTGNWEKKPTYTVSYKFVSGTSERGLPSPCNNYVPTSVTVNGTEKDVSALTQAGGVVDGTVLAPVQPSKTTVTVQYADGTKASWEFKGFTPTSATVSGSNVEFVGTWEMKQTFTITYSGNGGSGSVTDSNEYKALDSFTVLNNGFTRSGYSFVEWNTKSDGTGDKYLPGQSYQMPDPGYDLVLYAIWAQYKVTYRFVSGTSGKILPSVVLKYLPEDNTAYADGNTVNAIALVDSSGNPKTKVKLASGGTWYWQGWDKSSATMTSQGVVFTGTWTFKVKYDLTYDMNGGGGEQIYDKDSPYLKDEVFQVFAGPTAPTGMYFKCWREVKEDGSLGQEFHPGHSYKMPQRDLTLKAEWTTKKSEEDTGGNSGAGGGSGFISASDGTRNRYGDTTGEDGTMSGAEDPLEARNARTGDDRPIALYIILLAAAAAAVAGVLFIRRRKK